MRFVADKKPLPTRWSGHRTAKNLVAEADIFIQSRGRLAAKLLIFKNPTALHRFWLSINPDCPLGRGCWGAVNALARQVEWHGRNPRPTYMTGDRRYFCVIGLCANHLTMEIIAHEAVHAAYCYEKRARRNLFGAAAADFDEERIAYPAGRIAGAINRYLYDKNLYYREHR
jgi:hypothetical protein